MEIGTVRDHTSDAVCRSTDLKFPSGVRLLNQRRCTCSWCTCSWVVGGRNTHRHLEARNPCPLCIMHNATKGDRLAPAPGLSHGVDRNGWDRSAPPSNPIFSHAL